MRQYPFLWHITLEACLPACGALLGVVMLSKIINLFHSLAKYLGLGTESPGLG